MNSRALSKHDVRKKLETFVDELGLPEVLIQLASISSNKLDGADDVTPNGPKKSAGRKRKPRQNASETVENMDLQPSKREILSELAKSYDQRQFLPATSDINIFFESQKIRAAPVKSRSAAIPRVFRYLVSLSFEQLREISVNPTYFGPAKLGPLADAIQDRRNSLRNDQ